MASRHLRDGEHEHQVEEQLDERGALILGRYDGGGGHGVEQEVA